MKTRTSADLSPDPARDAFQLDSYMPHVLCVTSRRVSRLLSRRFADSFGLTIPEWCVLAVVGRLGTLSPSQVGEWTGMDKVKVSRSAASLVARGLIRQSQDPNDGRGRLLRLTRKGITAYHGTVPIARELESSMAQSLSRTEWAAMTKVLSKINGMLEEIDDPHGDVDAD